MTTLLLSVHGSARHAGACIADHLRQASSARRSKMFESRVQTLQNLGAGFKQARGTRIVDLAGVPAQVSYGLAQHLPDAGGVMARVVFSVALRVHPSLHAQPFRAESTGYSDCALPVMKPTRACLRAGKPQRPGLSVCRHA